MRSLFRSKFLVHVIRALALPHDVPQHGLVIVENCP